MHELSIAGAIVTSAARHAAGRRVTRVDVRVGYLRQVVPSALEFAWELVTAGTALDGAELVIEVVPVTVRCETCGTETGCDWFPLACGSCGGLGVEVIRGEELELEALEVEEEEELSTTGGI